MKARIGDIVRIEWKDATSIVDAVTLPIIRHNPLVTTLSIGQITSINKQRIALSSFVFIPLDTREEKTYRHTIFIPRCQIKAIQVLEKEKLEE